ncbi:MAG TPA: type I-C CRISPR-associated protein Cas8c/Csd1 [Candidatus Binataceae bacterium]|nr:type I-C CRISPR-associated protein Cas8c/Csd1 [Candidatus Binataceae bacterium]
MLLRRLAEYSDRLEPWPMLYAEAPVRYIIELDSDGNLLTPEPVDTAEPANPRTRRGQRRLVPQIQRSSGIKPILFASNSEYTLGLRREDSPAERVEECHRSYLELLRGCAERTELNEVRAVLRFLESREAAKLRLGEDFDRGAAVSFRVNGTFPSDLPAVQRFWADEHDPAHAEGEKAHVMQCVVCAETRPVLSRLQAKIKGIPRGQTSGTAIVSANADAFESYGLKASLVAPTCARCGERFTRGANHLLASDGNHIVVAGSAFIFWTREPSQFSFRDFLTNPRPEQVRALIDSVRGGRIAAEVKDTAFYAAALSASGGRVVVRDWIDTTVNQVRANLTRWFERQRIVTAFGEEPRPLGLTALAGATVRELRDLSPPVPRALLRSAMVGAPLPFDLLYEAVRRNRAEQGVTHWRAALIKLVLCSRPEATGEDRMVQLDSENQDPAYRCGRLLAVLEQAQRLAIPGIGAGATIVSRFYGSASSAPLSVFPRLLRGVQPHLAKLERDWRGAYIALQRRMEEIMGGIGSFPSTLTLEEQGLFSLGYYHQRAHDSAQAKETRAARRAAEIEEHERSE